MIVLRNLNILNDFCAGNQIRFSIDGHDNGCDNGPDYFCIRDFCEALGFASEQVSYQISKIRNDADLVFGYARFLVETSGGEQKLSFLRLDLLTSWLTGMTVRNSDISSNIQQCLHVLRSDGLVMADREFSVSKAVRHRQLRVSVTNISDDSDAVYLENALSLLPEFATDIISQCVWDVLPFIFLFDLFKSWLRRRNAFTKLPSIQEFTLELSGLDIPGWRIETEHIKSFGLMDAQEPLISEYRLCNWDKPYARSCKSGLVRILDVNQEVI